MTWAEADWERTVPPVPIERGDADALLGSLGPSVRLTPLPAGKANTNVRVDRAHGAPLVLRVYQRDPEALEREANLLGLVQALVPVPPMRARGTIGAVPAAVFDFVDGTAPTVPDDPQAAFRIGTALGETLARLTQVPVDGVGRFAPDLSLARRFASVRSSYEDLVRWSLERGRARRRLGPERTRAVLSWLPDALEQLSLLDAHPGLAHGDYKLSNLLVRPDGPGWAVCAVLDWEFACPFTPMLDVAILMRHRDGWPASFQDGFAAAYEDQAWLPPDWRRLSRILDVMNLVGFLNASGDRPRLYAHVIALLERTIAVP